MHTAFIFVYCVQCRLTLAQCALQKADGACWDLMKSSESLTDSPLPLRMASKPGVTVKQA